MPPVMLELATPRSIEASDEGVSDQNSNICPILYFSFVKYT